MRLLVSGCFRLPRKRDCSNVPQLGKWEQAAALFLRARDIAVHYSFVTDAISFGVDGAHALWRAGQKPEALRLFATCLDELERRAGVREPTGFHTLWKMTEHIVRWCSVDAGAVGEKYDVPYGGLCSEAKDEERHNTVKNHPQSPLPLIW